MAPDAVAQHGTFCRQMVVCNQTAMWLLKRAAGTTKAGHLVWVPLLSASPIIVACLPTAMQ
jgi:hypothetical protein